MRKTEIGYAFSPVIKRQVQRVEPLCHRRRFKYHKPVAVCLFLAERSPDNVLFPVRLGFHFDENFGGEKANATANAVTTNPTTRSKRDRALRFWMEEG
jgi:hypothetical protein